MFDLGSINTANIVSADLVLTIAQNANNWGPNNDRTVDVHRLNSSFVEGNGKNLGVPASESTRGDGPGATWNCAIDETIGNQAVGCETTWDGGDFASTPSDTVFHVNGQLGEVSWNVTDDVRSGVARWIIKKTSEGSTGKVLYYSREGSVEMGDSGLGPRLVINF